MHVCISSLPFIDGVATLGVGISGGHGPEVIVPWDDLGPTNAPLSVPPAMTVYVISHSNPSTVTVAVPLVTAAMPVCV